MRKNNFWTSIGFSIFGVVNVLLYIILAHFGYAEYRSISWLMALGYLVVIWVPMLLDLIFKLKFSLAFLVAFQVYNYLAICCGSLYCVYLLGIHFDKITHVFGGLIFALFCYEIFANNKNQRLNLFWIFVLTLSFSMMCGAVWEIYEFTADAVIGGNAQGAVGLTGREALFDTMFDLIADFAGAIVGAGISVWLSWKNKKNVDKISEKPENII